MTALGALTKLKRRLAANWPRREPAYFDFGGSRYRYFHHAYNHARQNDRAVEIPIAAAELAKRGDVRVLEIGHVLGHYLEHVHDVVDKYEPGPNVSNVDIADYRAPNPYDLIVSISTLKHVGWDSIAMLDGVPPDAESKDRTKIPATLRSVLKMLAPGGRLLVTVPVGYNEFLDAMLAERSLPFTTTRYLRRISEPNRWGEAS
jgi:SAM-dependent methyltransferase